MIKNLRVYPYFDSLGGNAITIRAFTDKGSYSASVPAKDDLKKTLRIFSSIRPNFIGLDEGDLQGLDAFLQELIPGEKPLSLAISFAIARSRTGDNLWKLGTEKDFPFPLANIISNKDMQEFFIIPYRAKNPQEAAKTCLEVYNAALEELKKSKTLIGRTPNGSWFCNLDLTRTLEFLSSLAGDWDLKIGVDFSGQRLWNGKTYIRPFRGSRLLQKARTPKTTYDLDSRKLDPERYLDFIEEISYTYRIYYLEDPFHKEDFESFSGLSEKLKKRLIIGNELYQASQERLGKGLGLKSGNGILIMPAQAGTLSGVLNLSRLAIKGKFFPVISQNIRETGDSWLSDLSILCSAPLLKIGLSGSERLGKLNRLIELWQEIPDARMAGLP